MSNSKKIVHVDFKGNGTASVQSGKKVTHFNVKDRDYTRNGVKYPGTTRHGHHAEVDPGKSVRLFGRRTEYQEVRSSKPPYSRTHVLQQVTYDQTFKVGDDAVYDSYNLIYVGKIESIGPKTITIYDANHRERKKLNLYEFSRRNDDFNAERIAAQNEETHRHI